MKANLNLYITRTITDTKTGKVIKKYRSKQAKSFVKAFLQMLGLALAHAINVSSDTVAVTDTGNTARTLAWAAGESQATWAMESPIGNITYGLACGIGTTPPATDDYTIETLIAEGGAATQFNYAATSVLAATKVGANMDMQIIRAMINNSGGTITVKEVGLIADSQGWYFLIVHDVVNDAVADGQTYTVTYTLRTTV